MTPTAPVPDAIFYPEARKRGRTVRERIDSVLDAAEPILGVDRAKGQHAYVRRQGGGLLFISRDPYDTINFPTRHPLRGRPRYDWIDGPDGIRRGYLTALARSDMETIVRA